MKLEIDKTGYDGAPTEAVLIHRNEEIQWNISLFDKMSYDSSAYDIFEQINGYWSRLPEEKQDNIFAIYKSIREAFDTIWDIELLTKRLYVLIHDLYEYHELGDVKHWIDFHSTLAIPASIKDEYNESYENPGSRERTYLKEDYKWLVTTAVALRAMIPVWGEFILRNKSIIGNVFKEYYAFKLLAHSNISRSEPMERLRIYVEHSLPQDKSKASAILDGISSEDFPMWVMALVVVRRLSVGDIRGIDPVAHLITFIYKFIGGKVKGHDNNFLGVVKDKPLEGLGQEGENNLSRLEGYKIKQELPAGDIAIISNYVSDVERMALKICPDIDLNLVRAANISVRALEIENIWKPQTILMQWVLKPAISPRGILYLNKTLTLNAMAVTQAILWHKGYHELAGLVSAIEQENDDEMNVASMTRVRIPKDLIEQLDLLFPFSRRSSGKQKIIKRSNAAEDAINSVAELFSNNNWKLTLPNEWVEKITGNTKNRRYSVPSNIKVLLTNLAIALANKSF